MPKGEVRKVEDYVPWSGNPRRRRNPAVQDGGRIKPLSTYAGFTMLGLHGARSMKISGARTARTQAQAHRLAARRVVPPATRHPPADLPRGQLRRARSHRRQTRAASATATAMPTSSPAVEKLGELAQSYQSIDRKSAIPSRPDRRPRVQHAGLRKSVRMVQLRPQRRDPARLRRKRRAGQTRGHQRADGHRAADPRADQRIQAATAGAIEPRLRDLLQQVLDASNFAKFGCSSCRHPMTHRTRPG
jgi:hypothetical protein